MMQDSTAQTPGQLLRAARLARGSDLTTAHEGTKIPVRLLAAIERDEYHQVSDQLYVRSFLRNYAGWLGLDAGEVLRLYDQVAGQPGAGRPAGAPVWSEDQVTVRRVGFAWPRYLVPIAAVLALAALVWFLLPRGGEGPVAPPPPIPVVPIDEMPPGPDPAPADRAVDSAADDRAAAPPPAAVGDRSDLPAPIRGDSRLYFAGGETFDLVLRILSPRAVNCAVRRDGRQSVPLIWPESPLPLPVYGVRHGQAYAVRAGYAAYWGARDHFEVTLDDLQGVEITLNGALQAVERYRPGQPFVLDRFALDTGGGGP